MDTKLSENYLKGISTGASNSKVRFEVINPDVTVFVSIIYFGRQTGSLRNFVFAMCLTNTNKSTVKELTDTNITTTVGNGNITLNVGIYTGGSALCSSEYGDKFRYVEVL